MDRPALDRGHSGTAEKSCGGVGDMRQLDGAQAPKGRPSKCVAGATPNNLGVQLAKFPDFYVRDAIVNKEDKQLSRAERSGLCVYNFGITHWEVDAF